MTPTDATELLRPGLLEGVALLVAGPPAPAGAQGEAVARAFSRLGAGVAVCVPDAEDQPAVDSAVAQALAELGSIDVLAVDGAGLFMHALSGGEQADEEGLAGGESSGAGRAGGAPTALRGCMDATWNVTRAVVNLAFLAAAPDSPAVVPAPVRRVLYLAPSPDAGEHAGAARAGLENLARTLSVEWARHGITSVTIAPAAGTPAEDVAAVAAYLASPAGAYFSGCLLDLGGAPREQGTRVNRASTGRWKTKGLPDATFTAYQTPRFARTYAR